MNMTQKMDDFTRKVWPFYLRLEKDFIHALDYVSFAEDNYQTYSIEFERQILSICSEFDIVCKLLCKEIAPADAPRKINEYYPILSGENGFLSTVVICEPLNKEVLPFADWAAEDSPDWWHSYNKIKHNRVDSNNYKLGNTINTFMSLAGLYAINRYYCKRVFSGRVLDEPTPGSNLFSIADWPVKIPEGNGFIRVLMPNGSMGFIHEN